MEDKLLGGVTLYIVVAVCIIPILWFLFIGPIIEGIAGIINDIKRKKVKKRIKRRNGSGEGKNGRRNCCNS